MKIAVKELARWDGESTKSNEADALERIRDMNHANLIQCIASIRQKDRLIFLFPWAEGASLREFWSMSELTTSLQLSKADVIEWALHQMRDLASGLCVLHEANMRHGDLKPENILLFNEGDGLGRLVITDLGLAAIHRMSTQARHVQTKTIMGTSRYEPPECISNPNNARSRRYDLWSMGCLFLEFAIWLIYGRDALHMFNSGFDAFACVRKDVHSPLNRKVRLWVDDMMKDPRCKGDTAIGSLLLFVMRRLLVPLDNQDGTASRGYATELYGHLSHIISSSKNSSEYLFDAQIWERAGHNHPPWHLSRDSVVPQHYTTLPVYGEAQVSSRHGTKTHDDPDMSGDDSRSILSVSSESRYVSSDDDDRSSTSGLGPSSMTSLEDGLTEHLPQYTTALGVPGSLLTIPSDTTISELATKFDSGLTITACTLGQASVSRQGTGFPGESRSQDGKGMPGKRRRRDGSIDEDSDEVEEDGGENEKNNRKKKSKVNVPRFACPFYKQNVALFKSRRTCCGPGFETTHRVKYLLLYSILLSLFSLTSYREHLFRKHRQPQRRCARCREDFDTIRAMENHLRSESTCEVNEVEEDEIFIDQKLERSLRRKPPSAGLVKKSEHEKWIDMFCLIFPNHVPIPSPCMSIPDVDMAHQLRY
jgi:serine/threonine protein kinase